MNKRSAFSTAPLAAVTLLLVSGCGGSTDEPSQPSPIPAPPPRMARVIMTVNLPGDPASEYGTASAHRSSGSLAADLEQRFPGLTTAPCLERAAGAYARTARADDLPLAFSEFVLHWAGCPDPFAAIAHVLTGTNDEIEFHDSLARMLDSVDATHVGVARVPAAEPYAWRWTVFLTNRRFEMQSVPTSAAPGTSLVLVFRLLDAVESAKVVTTTPNGRVAENEVGLSGDRMLASVELANRTGTQWIEVVAQDASGPRVVALFPVEIGRPPARTWIGTTKENEDWITDPSIAERFALALLREDRARFGLPSLSLDAELSAVARRHSAGMAASGEVSHVSITTGTVADRLESAEYPTLFAAENIARSSSVADAHEGLMRSPGHRAAILSTEATHVGIGIASRHASETGTIHYITQIFARPLVRPPTRNP